MISYKIQSEDSIINIKNKMTEIRRKNRQDVIHNYYSNCENDSCIWVVYGENSVVFWDDDNGVIRAYFYSSNVDELIELLKMVPANACLEFLTKDENSFEAIAKKSGFISEFTMNRYTAKELNREEKRQIREYWDAIKEAVYVPRLARKAKESDAEEIYKILHEVFNSREAHLCTLNELLDYIRNGWVCITKKQKVITGIEIFLVQAGYCKYGYQLWSGDGPESLCNLEIKSAKLYKEYLRQIKKEKNIKRIKPRSQYAWVNVNNRKAIKNLVMSGSAFDGLYDYGYKKIGDE